MLCKKGDQGVLEQRLTLVNLQCDIDHSDTDDGGYAPCNRPFWRRGNLARAKRRWTWAYSPPAGKPLSVPQESSDFFTRFGMDVVLAHLEGHNVMSEVEEVAKKNAKANGGSYKRV